jgi:lantibiotic modifying enzyme
MYRFLNRERYRTFADLTRQHLPKEIRHLRRPTIYYGRVLESSVAPAVMADGFERSVMLRAACGVAVVPRRWVTTEVRALENGDVPRLRSKAAGIRNAPSQIAVRRAVQTIKVALARADASTKQ